MPPSALEVGDIIAISYNEMIYEFKVLELKPSNAVTIIECDMNVDFAPPVGYEEEHQPKKQIPVDDEDDEEIKIEFPKNEFKPFQGTGVRVDGKEKKCKQIEEETPKSLVDLPRGIPDYNYKPGTLKFFRKTKKKSEDDAEQNQEFKPFSGSGSVLKIKKT